MSRYSGTETKSSSSSRRRRRRNGRRRQNDYEQSPARLSAYEDVASEDEEACKDSDSASELKVVGVSFLVLVISLAIGWAMASVSPRRVQ